MDNLVDQFLTEGRELVQSASDDLDALSARPDDADLIDNLFRSIHTLKGSTGLFDLQPLGLMLHTAEDLLGALRKGALPVTDGIIDTLIRCIDQTGRWLDAFETAGTLPPDAETVGQRLQGQIRQELAPGAPALPPPTAPDDYAWITALLAGPVSAPTDAPLLAVRYVPKEDCFFTGDDPLAILKSLPGLCALSIGPREPWPALEAFDPFRCNLVLTALTTAPRPEVKAALRLVADQTAITEVDPARRLESPEAEADAQVARDVANRTLRIDAGSIDALAHVADEIVIANNALAHLVARARSGIPAEALVQGLLANQLALDRLVSSLHRAVMRVRLVPLSILFRRFPRLVREIGEKLGKELSLVVRGDAIEVDKSVVDGLFDPLLHLLRNAADHGVETAEVRRQAGKPPRGVITLGATRLGDQVVIEVTDNGKGLDPMALRQVARDRALLDDETIDALSDQEAAELIFVPGFSTAAAITDISGRGIGMDSVRTAILKMGGRVALSSSPGAGTSVRLSLPISVVLSNVIVVACGAERYGVPMDSVIETVRIPRSRILPVRNGRAFVLRDVVIPVFDLSALLGLPPSEYGSELKLLIVQRTAGVVAVAVDDFVDRLNLLLRPLAGLLTGMPGVAGTALLGDGRVLMVLDLPELVG